MPYDLRRTLRRASVPPDFASIVPELPGVYAIVRTAGNEVSRAILDIGECGPRANSSPYGLRGRLATTVAHSASELVAQDIRTGVLQDPLRVTWFGTESKQTAKELQDALITLFRKSVGRQPHYNRRPEHHGQPELFAREFEDLLRVVGCKIEDKDRTA